MDALAAIPLADGQLILWTENRLKAFKVAAMARALIEQGCAADLDDSIATLIETGRWLRGEIMMLIADARHVARQYAVAMEMERA